MDGNDVSIFAVESTRDVKRFIFDVFHEKSLWERNSIVVFFDQVSCRNHLLHVPVGNFALAHSLFGVGRDEITILRNSLPKGRNIKFCHNYRPTGVCPFCSIKKNPRRGKALAVDTGYLGLSCIR